MLDITSKDINLKNTKIKEFISKDNTTRRMVDKTNNLLKGDKEKHSSTMKKKLE